MPKLESEESGTIAPLAIAGSFPAALIVETFGFVEPYGQIVRKPAVVGETIVTFTVAALALAGTPQEPPLTGKLRAEPDASSGPPVDPAGRRVSTIRQGVTE
jgi:hypothetical protein